MKDWINEIGFYQYYHCYHAQEEWYKIDEANKIYNIDYIYKNLLEKEEMN